MLGLSGSPLRDIAIYVNGVYKTTTNLNGKYFLDFDRTQTVSIEAKSERDKFDSIKLKVDQHTVTLPTLKAISVSLCGHVANQLEDNEPDNWQIPGYKASKGRRIFC